MSMRKIMVSGDIKEKLNEQFKSVENKTLNAFTAEVIEKGATALKDATPPGEEPRKIPFAHGKKTVEFSLENNRELVATIRALKNEKNYADEATTMRACLFEGLGIAQEAWK